MLVVRTNACRSSSSSSRNSARSPPFSVLLRTCVCLLVLLGPLAHSPVEGQYLRSPCPSVFSYRLDPGSNQVFGYVELQGLRIGQLVKLNVDLSIGVAVPQNNVGSITLVKSREQTFRDIYSNLPAQYRVNFPFNNVIPNVLAISVNGQNICTGQKASGQIVTTINLEHTLFTQMQPLSNDNSMNVNAIQFQPTQAPVYQPVQTQRPQFVQPVRPQPVQNVRPQPVQTVRPQPVQTQRPIATSAESQPSANVECGIPDSVFNRLSINGMRSPKGQFPWAVPIFDTGVPTKPRYICGSTIVSRMHLISAAHCMFDPYNVERFPNDLKAVPGMYNIDNFFESDLQERSLAKFFVHEDYDIEIIGLSDSDIALLVLDEPIVYNAVVKPICLWSGIDNLEQIIGVEGYVSGWGVTENGDAKFPSYVKATVVDRRECSRKLDRLIPSSARVFCGDGKGAIPCTGDSGSGLVIKRGQKFYLRGIVSIGQYDTTTLKCDTTKYVVYTDIAPYRYWLKQKVNS